MANSKVLLTVLIILGLFISEVQCQDTCENVNQLQDRVPFADFNTCIRDNEIESRNIDGHPAPHIENFAPYDAYLVLSFDSCPSGTVEFCCENYTYEATGIFHPSPTKNDMVRGEQLKKEPNVTIINLGGSSSTQYTLLAMSTKHNEVIWAVVNIANKDVTTGDVMTAWRTPTACYLVFILYLQQSQTDPSTYDITQHTSASPGCPDASRCNLDETAFRRSGGGLVPRGSNWVKVNETEYDLFVKYTAGQNKSELCTGRKNVVMATEDDVQCDYTATTTVAPSDGASDGSSDGATDAAGNPITTSTTDNPMDRAGNSGATDILACTIISIVVGLLAVAELM